MTKRSKRTILLVSAALVVLIGAWLFHLSRSMPSVAETRNQVTAVQELFQSYSSALLAGNYGDAFQVCSDEFKAATPFDRFVTQHRQQEAANGRLVEIEQIGLKVSADGDQPVWTAILKADYRFDKRTVRVHHEFRFINGKWFLTYYRVDS